MSTKILISGGSISAGYKLDHERQDPRLWVNQVLDKVDAGADTTNISVTGSDNQEIFAATADKLLTDSYDLIIVAWQTSPRINHNFGLETYSTTAGIIAPGKCTDIGLVGGQWVSGKTLDRAREYMLKFYNYHWDIKRLVTYVNVLKRLAEPGQIVFVNYAQPWHTHRYFDANEWTVPSELDTFTQELLEADLRDDAEVHELYNMCHRQYQQAGGIQASSWLNLYTPLSTLQVDTVADDPHPGYLSQDKFTEYLLPILKEKLQCQ